MLVKRMSTQQARANFSELLGSVYYTKNPIIVERKGKPVAVVISPDEYKRFRQEEKADWAIIDEIRARNAGKDPGKVLKDVTEVVEEVRQEMYDKAQKKAKKRSS